MIFGKTYKEQREREQALWKSWYEKWPRKFLWFPRQLSDGRVAWLTFVYVEHPIEPPAWCSSYWNYEAWVREYYHAKQGGKCVS